MKLSLGFLFFSVAISTSLISQNRDNISLLANWDGTEVPFNGSAKYNDVWGFEIDGQEFGCMGSTLGTHIFSLPENNHIEEVAYVPGRFQGPVVHRDFAFFEGYLYAVCDQGSSSLQVINVSNLPNEFSVALDDTTNFTTAHNITVDESGMKLYVSGPSGSALKVFDISDTPENPQLVSEFNLVEYVHDVFAKDNVAYLSAGSQGLFIYDFSNPANPAIISSLDGYPDEGYNHSGWLSPDGNYFAFADETPGKRMKIIDVRDPSDLEVISLFNSGLNSNTMPHNLEWIGDKIYVSHYYDGLQVFDVSDAENPVVCAYYDTYPQEDIGGRGAWGVHVMPSGRILISDRQSGFYLFSNQENNADELEIWLYPNPAEDHMCVNLVNESYLKVRFQIHDNKGLLVKDETYYNDEQPINEYLFNTNTFSAGIYNLTMILDEDLVSKAKFLIR